MLFEYSRLDSILALIKKQEEYTPLTKLTESFSISDRTLRTDITRMNETLEKHGASIQLKRQKGYYLKIEDQDLFKAFDHQEDNTDTPSEFDTPEQRMKYILKSLLYQKNYIRQEDLANELFISLNTVNHYLKTIKSTLKEYDLHLESVPTKGLKVIGSEDKIRRCMADKIINRDFENYLLGFTPEEKRIFKDIDLEILQSLIQNYFTDSSLNFSDFNRKNFMIHVAIMLSRIWHDHEMEHIEFQDVEDSVLQMVTPFIEQLEKSYQITIKPSERDYIYSYFISNTTLPQEINDIIDDQVKQNVTQLLENIYIHYNFDLRSDTRLFQDLSLHIKSLLGSKRYNYFKKNPLLDVIKNTYPLAYEVTLSSINNIFDEIPDLSEDEIAYIALHIGAGIERYFSQNVEKKHAVVVCGSGIGTGRLLETHLNSIFQNKIIIDNCLSYHQYLSYDFTDVDFVISTIPIENKKLPVITVGFPLASTDISTLTKSVALINENTTQMMMVKKFFSPHTFFCSNSYADKETLLKDMCERLKAHHYVDETFIDSVLYREDIAPTNVNDFMAIAHPMELIAQKTQVCVAISQKPILWNKENNTKVNLVFLLAVKKEDYLDIQHLYDAFIKIMNSRKLQDLILTCNKVEDFSNFIQIVTHQIKNQ